jgi:hypothetical protein
LSGEAAQSVNGPGDFKDISLYFLSAAVTDVEPEIVIAPDEVAQLVEGAPVEIAGWGQQVATSSPFEQPEPGTVGIKICGATTVNELGDKEMQVGGDASTTRKCHGDSGGPTYLDVDTDHARTRRVVGITSHAYDAEDCNKGGVDTRVDAWLSWMDTEMTKRCTDGTRVWCDVPGVIPASFYDPGNPGNPDDDGNGDDADDLGDDEEPPPFGCASTSPTSPTGGGALALVLLAVLRASAGDLLLQLEEAVLDLGRRLLDLLLELGAGLLEFRAFLLRARVGLVGRVHLRDLVERGLELLPRLLRVLAREVELHAQLVLQLLEVGPGLIDGLLLLRGHEVPLGVCHRRRKATPSILRTRGVRESRIRARVGRGGTPSC